MTLESIQAKIFGKGTKEDNLVFSLCFIMREFGYTLEEIKDLPIPTFSFIIKFLERESKEMDKKMKIPRKR